MRHVKWKLNKNSINLDYKHEWPARVIYVTKLLIRSVFFKIYTHFVRKQIH